MAQVFFDAMAKEGLNVCTPIDLSRSEHFDLRDLRLIDWFFYMILTRRFRAVLCEPTCTTFSPAQHPASRSYDQPLGFDRLNPKTFLGNLLAVRCLAIVWYAARHGLLEQPHLGLVEYLEVFASDWFLRGCC